ncbi:hypothetical protein L596_012583 [Steinernema carpocapsae]|uniref:Aldehyde dehydrogenase n=2 Tax=Steinernema carpocapsae TaxID=34508 RepID=A0A4U5NYF8_STECR|nr:hypothetical protein L596_012583 [Steinernema carpocapsae]
MAFHELVENQRKYFNTGETKKIEVRRQHLNTLRKALEENRDKFCEAVYNDHRRAKELTSSIEIDGSLAELDYFLANFEKWSEPVPVERTPVLSQDDVPMLVKDPVGVVLVIGPWNYPVVLVMAPLMAALAAGNTVVIKPSEVSANTSKVFENVMGKYFDKKVVAVVQGGVGETTELLKEHFNHILYTGAPFVGKIVMTAAAKHLTPVTLELGGKCPVVVADDADLEFAAKKVVQTKWVNCGQTCIAPDYAIVSPKVKSKFIDEVRKAIHEIFTDNVKASPMYSRMINERHFDRVKGILDRSKALPLIKTGELDRNDIFIPPLVVDVRADDAFMEDEIFGPVLPVLTTENLDETVKHISGGENPLAVYVFTNSKDVMKKIWSETHSGAVLGNDIMSHVSVMTLPFGGVGHSGMGRYRGKFGFDTFTHEKAVLLRNVKN